MNRHVAIVLITPISIFLALWILILPERWWPSPKTAVILGSIAWIAVLTVILISSFLRCNYG